MNHIYFIGEISFLFEISIERKAETPLREIKPRKGYSPLLTKVREKRHGNIIIQT